MPSSGGGIGTTITGGIQDIAAILPLLGTEQCSVQVSTALARDYLYAAATPMLIFGSLGVVIAIFKTLIAFFSLGNIEGAKIWVRAARRESFVDLVYPTNPALGLSR